MIKKHSEIGKKEEDMGFFAVVVTVLGMVVVMVSLIALAPVLNGYVLSILWSWFMVPTFHMPALSVVQAIGIGMVITFLTYHAVDCEKKERKFKEATAYFLSELFGRPLVTLVIGWIVHQFM